MKKLVKGVYPDANKIVVVMGNLNNHHISSLYESFPAHESFNISQKREINSHLSIVSG